MLNQLYITSVAVTKPIPEGDYIAELPTVRNLRAMGAPEQMIRYLEIGE